MQSKKKAMEMAVGIRNLYPTAIIQVKVADFPREHHYLEVDD